MYSTNSWISFPQVPAEYFISAVSNFLNSRRYSLLKANFPPVSLTPVKICHRWCTLTSEYLRKFLGEDKKTLKQKSRDIDPLIGAKKKRHVLYLYIPFSLQNNNNNNNDNDFGSVQGNSNDVVVNNDYMVTSTI